MRLSILTVFFWAMLATASVALCGGQDLRPGLSAEERLHLNGRLSNMPFREGLYWTATRGPQTLHVVGTVHIDDARLAPMIARLTPVIQAADKLFVEATGEEQAQLQSAITTRPELLFITDGPTLPDLMSETEWQTLRAAAQARNIPGFMAAKFQPWYLSLILSLPACAMETLASGSDGLDAQILDIAAAANRPAQALEPYDTLFTIMNAEPIEDQVDMLTLGALPDRAAEDGLATLLASYFEEKTGEVLEVARVTSTRHLALPRSEVDMLFDELLDTLLVKRNQAWMGPLRASNAKTAVIAVGAGHLPGTFGLLNLLAQDGYTLTRQQF